MKKLILLSVTLALLFGIACKKEKQKKVDKPVSEMLRGTWFTTLEKYEYFNASNVKEYEESKTPGVQYIINNQVTRKNAQGVKDLVTDYSVSTVNGKYYISFNQNGISETFQIVSVDDKIMVWTQEKKNQMYNSSGDKMAAKQQLTINFHCPCRD
ncbi:MAG TPA: hypothetical protein VEV16_01360 [Daejeonella sp.]|nr:hypothetical protein [Daejeonella sp.]